MSAVEARPASLPPEDSPAGAPTARDRPPLGRALLQPAWLAAVSMLALALAIGVLNGRQQAGDELESALATARLSRYLVNLPQMNDAQALTVLRRHADLRHLRLRVTDSDGNVRIGAELPVSATEDAIAWTVARPDGPPWTVTLLAAPTDGWSGQLLAALRAVAWLALALGVVMAALAWSLARTLAPAGGLLEALRRLQHGDATAVHQLPRMRVAELEAFRGGLLELTGYRERSEQMQRQTLQQLLALQEAERARLAHSLDNEFAQPLGSLRLDAAWLRRQLAANRQFEPVVNGMLAQLAALSHALDKVLARLNPLAAPSAPAATAATEHPDVLRELLQSLTEDGAAGAGAAARCTLDFEADPAVLPRALVLAVVRMSQEALRDVARHAGARQAALRVVVDSRSGQLRWSVTDDGRGPPATEPPGQGLSGLRALASAFGGELAIESGPGGHGLTLSATLSTRA